MKQRESSSGPIGCFSRGGTIYDRKSSAIDRISEFLSSRKIPVYVFCDTETFPGSTAKRMLETADSAFSEVLFYETRMNDLGWYFVACGEYRHRDGAPSIWFEFRNAYDHEANVWMGILP